MNSGIYQLLLYLPGNRIIEIGGLGRIHFNRGSYIYTGSAKGCLRRRLARHFANEKQLFWHIDYLRQFAQIDGYLIMPYRAGLECALSRITLSRYPEALIVPGFGCSDCTCESHLIYCGWK